MGDHLESEVVVQRCRSERRGSADQVLEEEKRREGLRVREEREEGGRWGGGRRDDEGGGRKGMSSKGRRVLRVQGSEGWKGVVRCRGERVSVAGFGREEMGG